MKKQRNLPMKFNPGLHGFEPDIDKLKNRINEHERNQIIQKITQRKQYSQLPEKDVEMAFSHFEKRQVSDEEKVRLTRELLHKVFSAFTSQKLLSLKDKEPEWILRKHISTKERLPYYKEIYKRILKDFNKKISVIDLGAGINGFSYKYFKNLGFSVNYVSVEAIGQLINLMNYYFEKEKINGKAFHFSLLEKEKVKTLIKKQNKPRVVFLFKIIDSLELLERHSSKRLLMEIVPLVEKVVVSFATRTLIRRKKFTWKRKWLINFIEHNFHITDDFSFGSERYIVFRGKTRKFIN